MRFNGERLNQIRLIAGMSVEALAAEIEQFPMTIELWERGAVLPVDWQIARLAEVFSGYVTPDWFFRDDPPPIPRGSLDWHGGGADGDKRTL